MDELMEENIRKRRCWKAYILRIPCGWLGFRRDKRREVNPTSKYRPAGIPTPGIEFGPNDVRN